MTKAQARCNLDSSIQAARCAISTATPGRTDVPHDLWMEHIQEIENAIARIRTGDLSDLEASLYSQIKALEKQYFRFSELGAQLYVTNPPASEKAFTLALKAQKQCRQTIAALNEMRNPKRAVFVRKQTNNMLLQQQPSQVQPDAPARHAHADVHVRSQLPQSQQKEAQFNATLDEKIPTEAGRTNTPVEAVGAEHRPNSAV